jgi:hypothetical protein
LEEGFTLRLRREDRHLQVLKLLATWGRLEEGELYRMVYKAMPGSPVETTSPIDLDRETFQADLRELEAQGLIAIDAEGYVAFTDKGRRLYGDRDFCG